MNAGFEVRKINLNRENACKREPNKKDKPISTKGPVKTTEETLVTLEIELPNTKSISDKTEGEKSDEGDDVKKAGDEEEFPQLMIIVIVASSCVMLLFVLILVRCYQKDEPEKSKKEESASGVVTPPSASGPLTVTSGKSNGSELRYKVGTPIVFDEELEIGGGGQQAVGRSETPLTVGGSVHHYSTISGSGQNSRDETILTKITNGTVTLPKSPVPPSLDSIRPPPPPYSRNKNKYVT